MREPPSGPSRRKETIGRQDWQPVRTNELLVLAGPPCAGKSTLISRIRDRALPTLCAQIGLSDPSGWTYVDATDLARMSGSSVDRLVLHYDLIVQRTPGGFRYLPEVISRAGNVRLVTLWIGPETLRLRSRERLAGGMAALIRHPMRARTHLRSVRRLWRRHRVFRDAAKVRRLYEDWFAFASSYPGVPHWVLDSSGTAPAVAERFEIAQRRMQEA